MKNTAIMLLVCLPLVVFGQVQVRDSLNALLSDESGKRDAARVNTLLQLARLEFSTDHEKMVALTTEAIEIAEEIGYDEALAKAYVYLGLHAKNTGHLDLTASYAMKSLTLNKKLGDDDGIARAYSMLGLVHQEMSDFEKARTYLEYALEINRSGDRKFELSNSYNNLGVLHGMMGDNGKAIEYFNEKLKLATELGDTTGMAESYTNIGHAAFQMGSMDEARRHFVNALRLMKARRSSSEYASGTLDSDRVAGIYLGLAKIFMSKGNATRALAVTDSALNLALASGNKMRISGAYERLASIHKSLRNYKVALENNEKYHRVKDSIFSETKARQIADLEARYGLAKKEQTIALLEKDSRIKALSRNLLAAGIVSVIFIAALLIYLQRQRNQRSRELLSQQEKLNAKLVETDQMKSRFFANISHEFRTPLTLILTPVEDKLASPELPEKDKITFQSIRRSANRLLGLINQLLEQSKLEAGFMKLELTHGKLSTFVLPVLSSFDSLADVGGVRFFKDLRLADAVVLFDSDKLEKILNNLLSNAFKFTAPQGCVHVTITSVKSKEDVAVTFMVRNDGNAIPPEQLSKVFDPFFQGENSVGHHQQGSGLGLSLVKELVRLHGGDVAVRSNETEGTTFIVNLTLGLSNATELETMKSVEDGLLAEEPGDNAPSADTSHRTILVVDDNHEVRTLIKEGLEEQYNILEAATGKEGILIAKNTQIDLIISDVMMPVMGGVEFCHLLKNSEATSHLPVVLLTARADHESRLEGLRTGADDYVVKPFNMLELQARVQNLIQQRARLIEKYHNHIVVQPHEITVTPLDERFIQQLISIIEKNLDNVVFDVGALTEEIGMSRTSLHRKLKAITGMSASEFVQDYRLKRAAVLISKKADSISQIAFQVGFNDQSYFTKCFRKKFGKTPTDYVQSDSGILKV